MTASRDARLARAMAERHDMRPNTVEPILDLGSVNHVFVVRSNSDRYVVRFARDPLRQNDFDLERWCLEQAIAHGFPSPGVVASGVHLGVPYLIQTYVEGIPGPSVR